LFPLRDPSPSASFLSTVPFRCSTDLLWLVAFQFRGQPPLHRLLLWGSSIREMPIQRLFGHALLLNALIRLCLTSCHGHWSLTSSDEDLLWLDQSPTRSFRWLFQWICLQVEDPCRRTHQSASVPRSVCTIRPSQAATLHHSPQSSSNTSCSFESSLVPPTSPWQ
jgi:hypothetical protein